MYFSYKNSDVNRDGIDCSISTVRRQEEFTDTLPPISIMFTPVC